MNPGRPPGDAQDDLGLCDITNCFEPPLEQNPLVIGGGAGCLLLLATIAGYSLGAVQPLHYGIRYNFFNKYADVQSVYGPGRYFIGPFSSFLIFPADVQSIEFTDEPRLLPNGVRYPALHTRTKEGLALHLQVSLQYQLTKEKVGMLYSEFNRNYEEMFIATIRDTLIRAAADYEAVQLWTQRKQVGERMQKLVNHALERTYATCWGLQLMVIDLPVKFEEAIVATQVQNQKIATREFQQRAATTRAHTKVIAAEYERKVKVIKAQGQANYTLITRIAKAKARKKVLQAETEVMENIKSKLKMAADELVEYQQFAAMSLMRNATLFYGFAEGTQVLMQQVSDTEAKQQAPARQPEQTASDQDSNDASDNSGEASKDVAASRSLSSQEL